MSLANQLLSAISEAKPEIMNLKTQTKAIDFDTDKPVNLKPGSYEIVGNTKGQLIISDPSGNMFYIKA